MLMDLKLRLGLPISKKRNFEEELELDEVCAELKKEYKPAGKAEREKIFLEDGSVSFGEAFEAKRAYLENKLIKTAQRYFEIQAHNEKYPEFPLELPNLKKAENDYDWHCKLNKDNKNIDIDWIKANRKIGEFVKINRGFVSCPFHKERTPSLKVNKEETLFNCFGCGVGGSVIDFVMKLNNLSFTEALKYLS